LDCGSSAWQKSGVNPYSLNWLPGGAVMAV
jgi:hypothetical protein